MLFRTGACPRGCRSLALLGCPVADSGLASKGEGAEAGHRRLWVWSQVAKAKGGQGVSWEGWLVPGVPWGGVRAEQPPGSTLSPSAHSSCSLTLS